VIEREFQFSFEIEDIVINGKIDRIDKGDTGYNVIDYKTSKKATKANKNIQLAIYSMYICRFILFTGRRTIKNS
jgi:RecB family exonuclease